MSVDSYRDIALWRVMMAAAQAGLRYDPVVEQRGRHHLDEALDRGGGILLAAPHSLLGYILLRLLRDGGRTPVAITSGPGIPIFGTSEAARVMQVSDTLLADSVRLLRSGGILCAMIDRPGPEANAFELQTVLGPLYISDALLRFALRERASILFCTARMDGERLVVSWSAPSDSARPEGIGREFADFVEARIAEGHGRDGPRARAISKSARAIPVR